MAVPVHDRPAPIARWAYGAVWVSAAALLIISLAGYLYHRRQLADIAADHLRFRVIGPARVQAGAGHRYQLLTTSVTGRPVSVAVDFSFQGPGGRALRPVQHAQTDARGRLEMVVPAPAELPERVQLRWVAGPEGRRETVHTTLPAFPPSERTWLWLDQPWYRPGARFRYRALTLAEPGFRPAAERRMTFEVHSPRGQVWQAAEGPVLTQTGLAWGEGVIPEDAPEGDYTLVARCKTAPHGEAQGHFRVLRDSPSNEEANTAATGSGEEIAVTFYPEGGHLVAGLDNRIFFTARDAGGQPIPIRGRVVTSLGNAVSGVNTAWEGMGVFSLRPAAGEKYRLQITEPADVAIQPLLPSVREKPPIVLNAGTGLFRAGRPLSFNVRSRHRGLPLVAAAYRRGRLVGQTALVTRGRNEANPVTMALDDQVGGILRLVVFDYHRSPPRPLVGRLVYRPPANRLNVSITGTDQPIAPGGECQLRIAVTGGDGRPRPAVVGLHVTRGAGGSAGLATQALLAADIALADRVAAAGATLPGDGSGEVAWHMLLGCQDWPRLAYWVRADRPAPAGLAAETDQADRPPRKAWPPAVFDNLDQLEATYHQRLADYRASRTRWLNLVTTFSLFGGAGLVLLAAMLTVLDIATGLRLWGPALAAATVGLGVGTVLLVPEKPQGPANRPVPFTSFHLDPDRGPAAGSEPAEGRGGDLNDQANGARSAAEDDSDGRENHAGPPAEGQPSNGPVDAGPTRPEPPAGPGPEGPAPATVYWDPFLKTDASGRAEARFPVPERAGTLQVTVEALAADGAMGAARSAIPAPPVEVTAEKR